MKSPRSKVGTLRMQLAGAVLALHALPRIGDYRLDHVGVREIEELVRDPVGRDAGAATANKILGTLRNFWRFARRREYAQTNPAADVAVIARVTRGRGAEVVYSAAELRVSRRSRTANAPEPKSPHAPRGAGDPELRRLDVRRSGTASPRR
jgi:hypothetical protein